MLVLTRKRVEALIVGGDIILRIIEVNGQQVKIGITAPDHVSIDREEIHERKLAETAYREA